MAIFFVEERIFAIVSGKDVNALRCLPKQFHGIIPKFGEDIVGYRHLCAIHTGIGLGIDLVIRDGDSDEICGDRVALMPMEGLCAVTIVHLGEEDTVAGGSIIGVTSDNQIDCISLVSGDILAGPP
jgi:hypothetical protein